MKAHHRDLEQRYLLGSFWTVCVCGLAFEGADPDAADAAHSAHRDGELIVGRPIAELLHAVYS